MATKVTKASPEATPAPGHSAGPAPAGIQGRRYLLLLDMNGTVCYRSEEPVPGVRPDLYVRRKFFYRRGGVGAFVSRLVGSGSFDVCVYTSMMAHNVVAGLDAILPNYRRLLLRVLDRKMTKPDPEGENEWDTVRDMEKVLCVARVATSTWQLRLWPQLSSTTLTAAALLGCRCGRSCLDSAPAPRSC